MILFVFEGAKREPALFQTIFHLFFPHAKDKILCSYNNNIYNLYKEMHPDEDVFTQDIVSVLRQQWQGKPNNPFKDINQTSDFSEVFLFFDYDCHHQNKNQTLTVQQLNNRLKEMLAFFNNETENGKLYLNYPMIESIRYTKQLPDKNYNSYIIPLSECGNFKQIAAGFSFYPNLDFISFRYNTKNHTVKFPREEQYNIIKQNWHYLIQQNREKSLYLTSAKETTDRKHIVSQLDIFSAQVNTYINSLTSVSILNSIPLFIYEYFDL